MMIRPVKDKNAIAMCVIAIEIGEELSQEQLIDIETAFTLSEASHRTPRVQRQKSISLSLPIHLAGQAGQVVPTQTEQVVGIRFDSSDSDEGSLVFEIRQNAFVFYCNNYTSWTSFKEFVAELLNSILDKIGPFTVAGTTLEYVDEFHGIEKNTDWKIDLFNKQSSLLPRSIFDYDSFWHVQCGLFSNFSIPKEKDNAISLRMLTNYLIAFQEIDSDNDTERLMINMKSSHKVSLQDYSFGVNDFIESNKCFDIFDNCHTENISLMKEILSSEMCKRIDME